MKKKRQRYWLECSECKGRNYKIIRSIEKKAKNLEIKKYCAFCHKHTVHVEVR